MFMVMRCLDLLSRWSFSTNDAHHSKEAGAIGRGGKSDEACDVPDDMMLRKQSINKSSMHKRLDGFRIFECAASWLVCDHK